MPLEDFKVRFLVTCIIIFIVNVTVASLTTNYIILHILTAITLVIYILLCSTEPVVGGASVGAVSGDAIGWRTKMASVSSTITPHSTVWASNTNILSRLSGDTGTRTSKAESRCSSDCLYIDYNNDKLYS